MKIVVTDWKTVSRGDLDEGLLQSFGEVFFHPLTDDEQLIERIADADAVLCNKSRMTADVIAAAPNLRYIGLFATGYNNIDIDAARAHGVTVCNAGSYSTEAVAQHTFALLLELAGRVSDYHAMVQAGEWIRSDVFSPFRYPMTELCGKTMGVIGYGSIAKAVIRIAKAFGMTVLCHTRTPREAEGVQFVSFEQLLTASDVVSVHCPLTDKTHHLFNRDAFSRMKDGAWFINTARGPIVDEQALREALDAGKVGGAAVDVLAQEPMSGDCPLLGAPNCIITPHVAWAPLATRERLLHLVCDNLRAYLSGTPQNVVS